MNTTDYCATFACLNKVEYTQQCIESLQQSNFDMRKLVIVDNGSTDSTWDYISGLPDVNLIRNKHNLGCGVAWNQGALALQAEWTVIMNNDILFAPDWIESLIAQAQANNLLLASPAMIEGPLDYDFYNTAAQYKAHMKGHIRPNAAHAVCLLVHNSVWKRVGYFRATPKLLGFEDTIFFFECMKEGIAHAALADSWIHHYGSVTVKALREAIGTNRKGGLGSANNNRLLDQGWLMRKWRKFQRNTLRAQQREHELQRFGCTLHSIRKNGDIHWY
jgi:GT2 family glycosyltransferase